MRTNMGPLPRAWNRCGGSTSTFGRSSSHYFPSRSRHLGVFSPSGKSRCISTLEGASIFLPRLYPLGTDVPDTDEVTRFFHALCALCALSR